MIFKNTNNFINGKSLAVLPEAYAPFDPLVDSVIKLLYNFKNYQKT